MRLNIGSKFLYSREKAGGFRRAEIVEFPVREVISELLDSPERSRKSSGIKLRARAKATRARKFDLRNSSGSSPSKASASASFKRCSIDAKPRIVSLNGSTFRPSPKMSKTERAVR